MINLPKYLHFFRSRMWRNLRSSNAKADSWKSDLPCLTPLDAILLSSNLDNSGLLLRAPIPGQSGRWLDRRERVPPLHLLRASLKLDMSIKEVQERLEKFKLFGLKVPQRVPNIPMPSEEQDLGGNLELRLLSKNLDGKSPWLEEGTVPLSHLWTASRELKLPVGKIIEKLTRFRSFGIEPLDGKEVNDFKDLFVGDDDLVLLSLDLQYRPPSPVRPCQLSRPLPLSKPKRWLDSGRVSPLHLLRASLKLDISIKEVRERLEKFKLFGLEIPDIPDSVQALNASDSKETILKLLSKNLDGQSPWLEEGLIPLPHLLHASGELGLTVGEVLETLKRFEEPFDLKVTEPDGVDWTDFKMDKKDLELLSQNLGSNMLPSAFGSFSSESTRWFKDGKIPLGHLLYAREKLAIVNVVDRLQRFEKFQIKLPPNAKELAQLKFKPEERQNNLILLSQNLNGNSPWLEGNVSPLHILHVARKLSWTVKKVVRQFKKFEGFGLKLLEPEQKSWPKVEDLILLSRNFIQPNSTVLIGIPHAVGVPYESCLKEGDEVTLGHILRVAETLPRWTIQKVVKRLEKFEDFDIKLVKGDWEWEDFWRIKPKVTVDDFLMLSEYLDGELPLLEGDVSKDHIRRAADLRNWSYEKTLERFRQFEDILNLQLPE